jgi:hypothetical protein
MRYSEIAASLRISVCPGRMQHFAEFPQKLFWIKRASDKRQTGHSEIEATHPGRDISKKAKVCPETTDNINENKFDLNKIKFDRHRILS